MERERVVDVVVVDEGVEIEGGEKVIVNNVQEKSYVN
jgi:hypothetical protein